mgnify:FL=1
MTRRLKIFIADDDAFFLSAIQLIIQEEEGMEVVETAGNGVEASQKIRELMPDIVLMDSKCPR